MALSVAEDLGGEGDRITQHNLYISISRVLTFGKVLFFIYLQIDVQRTPAEQPFQSRNRAGPTARPASGMTAVALGVLQNKNRHDVTPQVIKPQQHCLARGKSIKEKRCVSMLTLLRHI